MTAAEAFMVETNTMTQSPLPTPTQLAAIEQQVTVEKSRPCRRPPPTPIMEAASDSTNSTNSSNLKDARIAELELLVQKEANMRKDTEERLSIVIAHSEHRLSEQLSQKEKFDATTNKYEEEKDTHHQELDHAMKQMERMKEEKNNVEKKLHQVTEEKETAVEALHSSTICVSALQNEMSEQISEQASKYDALWTKLNGVRVLRELCQKENTTLVTSIKELTAKFAEEKQTAAKAVAHVHSMEEKHAQHQQTFEEHALLRKAQTETIEHLEKKVIELNLEIEQRLEVEQKLQEIECLESSQEIETMSQEIQLLRMKNAEIEQKLHESNVAQTTYQRNVEKMDMDLEIVRNESNIKIESILKKNEESVVAMKRQEDVRVEAMRSDWAATKQAELDNILMPFKMENATLKQEVVSVQETLAQSERLVSEMKHSKETIEEEHRSVTIKLVTTEESLHTAATELEQTQCELQIKVNELATMKSSMEISMKTSSEASRQAAEAAALAKVVLAEVVLAKAEAAAEAETAAEADAAETKAAAEAEAAERVLGAEIARVGELAAEAAERALGTERARVEELERSLKENKCSVEALRVEISTVTTYKDALQSQMDEQAQRVAASANDPNYPKFSENEYSEYGRQQIALGKSQQAMEEEATRSSSAGVSEEEMSALLAKHQEELKAAEEKHTSEVKTLMLQTKQAEQLLEEEKRAKEEGADLALQGLNMIQTECDQKVQAMESEVKQSNEKMEMMTNKHTTHVQLVSQGNATIKEKEQEILALKAQKDSFSRKEEQFHEKEQINLGVIKASKMEIEKFEAVTKKTGEIKIALEKELKTTKKHLKLAKQTTEGMEAYVKREVAAGQKAVDAKTKEIRDMKKQFKKTKESRLSVIAKMKALETELEEKKEFFKKSNMKNAEELTAKKGLVDRLQERVQELLLKQESESKQVLSLTSENADMEMKLSELAEEKNFLMSTLETVMAELEESRRMMPQAADGVLISSEECTLLLTPTNHENVVETY